MSRLKLIPDWRLAWRFASVQAAVLLALLSGLQAEVLPLISPLFPPKVWPWVSGSLALAVVVSRLVAQDGLRIGREQLAREAAQSPAGERPGDVSPVLGAALLVSIGLVIALLIAALAALQRAVP